MSAHSPVETDLQAEVDAERRWSVYRCAHGCFHVALDRLTLTLTDEEFHALQMLMRRSCLRFHHCGPSPSAPGRAH